MLGLLHIENIAVIQKTDIDFREGFNVLTGETGAGKSIIIDSIGALLGERTSRDLIRSGERFASVSGWFTSVGEGAKRILSEAGAEESPDGTLSIERRLYADGRNICRANGSPISLSALKELGNELVSIHGQHDSRILLDPAVHINILDGFADNKDLLDAYSRELAKLKAIRKKQKAVLSDSDERERRRSILEFQINELESANLSPGEYEELEKDRKLMRDSEKLASALKCASGELSGDDSSVSEKLSTAASFVRVVGDTLGDELALVANALEEAAIAVRDCAETVDKALSNLNFSERDIDKLEDRLSALTSIRKKYGGSVESAIEYLNSAREELDSLENSEEVAKNLEEEYRVQYAVTLDRAQKLSKSRVDAARRLEEAVCGELEYLCMAGAKFKVQTELRQRDGRTIFGNDGIDIAEFYLAANRGEGFRPLARSASGGELSRVMLAMCTAGGQLSPDTVIFDEIDAGISGIAASRVADRLSRLSAERQVLCVTHLSQLAAAATAHFLIRKGNEGDRTFTSVTELDREGRISEIARINAGEGFSDAIRLAAAEQLDAAKKRTGGLI
ncbi:MAG: DNA repair protein RecN [Clostridia bacterium]|nr:DNA repair protein RecN [Clostridia bacterium]